MQVAPTIEQVKQLVGKRIAAVKKDGTVVFGQLVNVKGQQLTLKPDAKDAATKAIVPLVLFDLLAIGTAPFAYGGFGGYGFGGYGGYGGYGGFPFFF